MTQPRHPVIDPRVLAFGVSKLREMDAAWLRDFSTSDEIAKIQHGAEPLAVLVPYHLFLAMQSAADGVRVDG